MGRAKGTKNKHFHPNKFTLLDKDVMSIKLKEGYFAIIDIEDYEKIKDIKWSLYQKKNRKCFYSVGYDRFSDKKVQMARVIMGVTNDLQVDHIDRNGLNNRKNNLRICTNLQNNMNKGLTKRNKSGYKGVCYCKRDNKWESKIKYNGKTIYLGRYEDKIEAAKVYNEKALLYYGEYAYLNKLNS